MIIWDQCRACYSFSLPCDIQLRKRRFTLKQQHIVTAMQQGAEGFEKLSHFKIEKCFPRLGRARPPCASVSAFFLCCILPTHSAHTQADKTHTAAAHSDKSAGIHFRNALSCNAIFYIILCAARIFIHLHSTSYK